MQYNHEGPFFTESETAGFFLILNKQIKFKWGVGTFFTRKKNIFPITTFLMIQKKKNPSHCVDAKSIKCDIISPQM